MRLQNCAFFLQLFILLIITPSTLANWGFVNPQSDCKINCLNGGVCAFDIHDKERHKCICLVDMFEGDLCQYPVTSSTTTQEPLAATDGQMYDEEDFHEASPDLHYTEFNGRGNDDLQKVDNVVPSNNPSDNQADDYAEFEPHHNDELYHEAVISPSETSVHEPEPSQTIQEQTTHTNSYYQPRDNHEDKNDVQPEQEDDEFYEDDSSWMMFKRRAVNGATNRQQHFLCIGILTTFAFLF